MCSASTHHCRRLRPRHFDVALEGLLQVADDKQKPAAEREAVLGRVRELVAFADETFGERQLQWTAGFAFNTRALALVCQPQTRVPEAPDAAAVSVGQRAEAMVEGVDDEGDAAPAASVGEPAAVVVEEADAPWYSQAPAIVALAAVGVVVLGTLVAVAVWCARRPASKSEKPTLARHRPGSVP